ncbi:geranylgeranylglyceryl/heptaprenylglyceryl phosphate synthase [Marivirga harenae]|uniref:geranylgeranylglyceryl/heptaprenylglyceryl phosphate synthase n=1 Tax=Marivirga harenae TaxID=2010992 RepID=UPI0026DEC92B|nr:geranylgeranylglyceryl/heptaprenylglyceryl phosphate synthase [Marivirga harenae]WKV12937.1 geranylgeranylglyceryl/heptaprenylglyceryl phosphate synthase [Marivirga harenae]|tara:strand:- start:51590 stop:52360 length:771 start_codon:yes stop_codon:yes gene_type:complete
MIKKEKLNRLINHEVNGQKCFALLIDPDKVSDRASLQRLVNMAIENEVDFFFVGGSLIVSDSLSSCISDIKSATDIPVILFPGNNQYIDLQSDAILYLSLISGRNPDLLIGQHVLSAPILKRSNMEVWPTGYMLIDGGNRTSVSYMSNTNPIPYDKHDIAVSTAIAGELLGLQLIYMDAGSGADKMISEKMIASVKRSIEVPLIIGGGINSVSKAKNAWKSGADVVVVGNAIEQNPQLLIEMTEAKLLLNRQLHRI